MKGYNSYSFILSSYSLLHPPTMSYCHLKFDSSVCVFCRMSAVYQNHDGSRWRMVPEEVQEQHHINRVHEAVLDELDVTVLSVMVCDYADVADTRKKLLQDIRDYPNRPYPTTYKFYHVFDHVMENPNIEECRVNMRLYTNWLTIMTRFPTLPNGRWCQLQELKCNKISEDVNTEMAERGVFG